MPNTRAVSSAQAVLRRLSVHNDQNVSSPHEEIISVDNGIVPPWQREVV